MCELEFLFFCGTSAQYEQKQEVSLKELESRATLSKISLDYGWDSEREG